MLLLHGFPDDATGWAEVIEGLSAHGFRVLAPFVRGVGQTRFRNDQTPRAGDFAALGQDALDFVDALRLRGLTVVGQDWGSPTAEIVAIERPNLITRLVKLNWYGVYTMAEMMRAQGFHYEQLRTLWYVWLFQTPLGEIVLRYDRNGLAKALWAEWSPTWQAEARDKALASVVGSFGSDDWVRVVLSAYRSGAKAAELDPADEELRNRLKEPVPVQCETIVLTGADDGVERTPLNEEAQVRYFPAGLQVQSLTGVGHFPQREKPEAVVQAIGSLGAKLEIDASD